MKRVRDEGSDLPPGIEIGKRYKLQISREGIQGQKLLSLQYTFKPANVDTSQPGELSLSSESQEAHLKLKKEETGDDMRFEGMKMQGLASDHQYVLQLGSSADNGTDGVCFLRKVDQSIANLKYKHSESSAMLVGIDNKKNKLKDFLGVKEKTRQKALKQQQQQAAKEAKESTLANQTIAKTESGSTQQVPETNTSDPEAINLPTTSASIDADQVLAAENANNPLL